MVAAEQVNLSSIENCLVLFGITYQEEYCVVLLDFLFFFVCGFCSVQTRQWILLLVGSSSFSEAVELVQSQDCRVVSLFW